MLFLRHWNCKIRPHARVILLSSIVWCLVIPNTTVYSGCTIHFRKKHFTAVIAWTWSWLGRRVSIMAPLLCRQRQSGMLGFWCCFQHLLPLTLDPSPSNAHSCRHWKHTTVLRMVIISIISLISVMRIIHIILIKTFQVGWNLSVPVSCTS
jgi:hypothetical protein